MAADYLGKLWSNSCFLPSISLSLKIWIRYILDSLLFSIHKFTPKIDYEKFPKVLTWWIYASTFFCCGWSIYVDTIKYTIKNPSHIRIYSKSSRSYNNSLKLVIIWKFWKIFGIILDTLDIISPLVSLAILLTFKNVCDSQLPCRWAPWDTIVSISSLVPPRRNITCQRQCS